MTKRDKPKQLARGRQGAAMKLLRAGAFAGPLLLFPQVALGQEDSPWRADVPVWRAIAPAQWTNIPETPKWSKISAPAWASAPPLAPIPFEPAKPVAEQPDSIKPVAPQPEPGVTIQLMSGREVDNSLPSDRVGTFLPDPMGGAPAELPAAPNPIPSGVEPQRPKILILIPDKANEGSQRPQVIDLQPDVPAAPAPPHVVNSPPEPAPIRVDNDALISGWSPIQTVQPVQALPAPGPVAVVPGQTAAPEPILPLPGLTAAKLSAPQTECSTCAPEEPNVMCRRLLDGLFRPKPLADPSRDPMLPLDGDAAPDHSAPRLNMRAEFLLWWMNNDRVPVLGTTGTPASGGILGQPGTTNLFGPGAVDLSNRMGGRFGATLLLDESSGWGVDGNFLFLGQRQSNYLVSSANTPVISRPVFVLNNNQENAETVAFPNFSTGSLQVDYNSQFWGYDLNIFKRLCSTCNNTFDLFAGYRFLNLSESIDIMELITAGPLAPDPVGTHVGVTDRFATRNVFNGGQLGACYEGRWGRWFVDVRASVALGANDESISIDGSQVKVRPGQAPQVFTGGLLAALSNVGQYSADRFSVVPDVSVNLGYQFTPYLRGFVGYSFIYWSNVVRPGEQIDRTVDLTFIPNAPSVTPTGQRRPAVLEQQSDFWAQGINFGFQLDW
jgi:hypothetical protein